jgi:hypothetical protein
MERDKNNHAVWQIEAMLKREDKNNHAVRIIIGSVTKGNLRMRQMDPTLPPLSAAHLRGSHQRSPG